MPAEPVPPGRPVVHDLGIELLGDSMLIFETAGVTLLATMVGAVVLSSRSGRFGAADEGSLSAAASSRAARRPARQPEDEQARQGTHHGMATERPRMTASLQPSSSSPPPWSARPLRRAVAAVVRDADDGVRADAQRRAAGGRRRSGRSALGGAPKGQFLAIVVMAVMAVEMAIGFALVVAVYRKRQADTTESLTTLKH